jgi:hypothetical protein
MLENVEAIEPKKPAKLFIATPMYGGLCVGGYTMGILNCVQTFQPRNIQMYYSYMMNELEKLHDQWRQNYKKLEADYTQAKIMYLDSQAIVKYLEEKVAQLIKG